MLILAPFQGDLVVRVVPRPEGLGYSVFALRAIGNAHKKTSTLQAPKDFGAEDHRFVKLALMGGSPRRRRRTSPGSAETSLRWQIWYETDLIIEFLQAPQPDLPAFLFARSESCRRSRPREPP